MAWADFGTERTFKVGCFGAPGAGVLDTAGFGYARFNERDRKLIFAAPRPSPSLASRAPAVPVPAPFAGFAPTSTFRFLLYPCEGEPDAILLRGLDAAIFVASRDPSRAVDNLAALSAMRAGLARERLEVPVVVQLNAVPEQPAPISVEALRSQLGLRPEERCVEAVGARGRGILETLKLMAALVLDPGVRSG